MSRPMESPIGPQKDPHKNIATTKKRNLGASQLQAAKEGIPKSTGTW